MIDPIAIKGSCLDKRRYGSEDDATAVAVQCWWDRRISLRSYLCPNCGSWHLTKANAEPIMKPGWRLPRKSERQMARDRYMKKRR